MTGIAPSATGGQIGDPVNVSLAASESISPPSGEVWRLTMLGFDESSSATATLDLNGAPVIKRSNTGSNEADATLVEIYLTDSDTLAANDAVSSVTLSGHTVL
ncbi:hypothetical protein C5B90_05870 [Haloferax sp. Atlit-12N]|uniref:hypothetical protein n=1 Tax=Haloferax sp. Atlit-12N TaxID=2077203 RepID=UPI000E22965B|nr:hypothetical protein [Haloferax sp. Atlit-12N]RDZ65876.1 hypothetical protein C5B90_05870 [Haloferax sp. Atlit-12N]